MRFKLYREYGALNSPAIFNAFEKGVQSLGHEVVTDNEDVSVIWSVLWAGRMAKNKIVYEQCKKLKRPIVIIEVGNFKRGKTWRISLDNINGLGSFGNEHNLDLDRPKKMGLLLPLNLHRKHEILIAAQHEYSLQWQGMPTMKTWCEQIILEIKQKTNRKIIVRPHPRSLFTLQLPGVTIEQPTKTPNTYDDFNIDYNYHCVINHNSGPAVQAAIRGVPVLCDSTSLAAPLSITWDALENPNLPDREDWFLKLCHTEWTVDEISQGIPLARLFP
jgi:hypothetical protein